MVNFTASVFRALKLCCDKNDGSPHPVFSWGGSRMQRGRANSDEFVLRSAHLKWLMPMNSRAQFCKFMKTGYILASFRQKPYERSRRISKISSVLTDIYRITIYILVIQHQMHRRGSTCCHRSTEGGEQSASISLRENRNDDHPYAQLPRWKVTVRHSRDHGPAHANHGTIYADQGDHSTPDENQSSIN
jgi:hypothetical protein